MRSRLLTIPAVALLAVLSPGHATAAETPWTPVAPAPSVPGDLSGVGLFDVTAVSPADVWAVGGGWSNVEEPVIEHWTGAGWDDVKEPSAPDLQYSLASVDAVSARDVWAVGSGEPSPSPGFSPIAVFAHYDGMAWSLVPAPTPPPAKSDVLTDVDMLSATDGWAVGWRVGAPADPIRPLAMRWRDGRWATVSLPTVAGGNALLEHVYARAGNDVWAVGSQGDSALVMHFDGTRWTRVAVPHGGAAGATNDLHSVTAVSAGEVWAVGDACVEEGDGFACRPLTLRLCGGVWRAVPTAGDAGTNLLDVIALSADDVWVVGYDLPSGGQESNHVEHWDGRRFATVPAVSATIRGQLASALEAGTRVPGTGELWAVGWQETGPQVIRHG